MPRNSRAKTKAKPVSVPKAPISPLNEKRSSLHAGQRAAQSPPTPEPAQATPDPNVRLTEPAAAAAAAAANDPQFADHVAGGGEEVIHSDPLDGEVMPPAAQPTYTSRIRIVDAWQYNGSLQSAPSWIDRNWVGFADNDDPIRQIAAGPCLRVPRYMDASGKAIPTTNQQPEEVVICRIGDYVARQEILTSVDLPSQIKIEVWAKEQFQRLFIPTSSTAPSPTSSADFRPIGAGAAVVHTGPEDSTPPPDVNLPPRHKPMMTPGFESDRDVTVGPYTPQPARAGQIDTLSPDPDIEEMPPYAPLKSPGTTSSPPRLPGTADDEPDAT